MLLFGGAAKYTNFTNSKKESFVANSNGTKFGTIQNDTFVPYKIFDEKVQAASDYESDHAYCFTDGNIYFYVDEISTNAALYGTLTGVRANSLGELFDYSDEYTISSLTNEGGILINEDDEQVPITRSASNDL